MTGPGRRVKPLHVLFWIVLGVVLAGAAGVALFFTVVPARVRDEVPEPHVVGSEAPEIAARLGKLTPAERADDASVRRAAAVEGAVANEITRDVARMTVVTELLSPDPDRVCYAFTVLPAAGEPVRYERLPSCP